MQSFIVLASLAFKLAEGGGGWGGGRRNDPLRFIKHLSPLKNKEHLSQKSPQNCAAKTSVR